MAVMVEVRTEHQFPHICQLSYMYFFPESPSFGSGSPDGASHMDCSLEYLADLVKEKKDLEMFGDNFQHVDRLLSEGMSFEPNFRKS